MVTGSHTSTRKHSVDRIFKVSTHFHQGLIRSTLDVADIKYQMACSNSMAVLLGMKCTEML